jgi:hypothetical protein
MTLSLKTHHKKGLVEWLKVIKVKALSSSPSADERKEKKEEGGRERGRKEGRKGCDTVCGKGQWDPIFTAAMELTRMPSRNGTQDWFFSLGLF